MTFAFLIASACLGAQPTESPFAREKLVAWCIVPFDAKKRGPEARADMLNELGLKRVAYDWRAEHVPTFEAEILAYKKHGLEFFAFWDWHPSLKPLIRKHDIHPQIWKTNPSPKADTQQKRVELAAQQLLPLVKQAGELNCQFGLYNHGGWGGEPENLVAVCEWLRKHEKANHIGIVYNFHHGHEHINDFAASLQLMKPYLLCVNINGMNPDAKPKILPIGDGKHEVEMIRVLSKSGYSGPIGVLDHRPDQDARKSLKQNLDGLEKTLHELQKKP